MRLKELEVFCSLRCCRCWRFYGARSRASRCIGDDSSLPLSARQGAPTGLVSCVTEDWLVRRADKWKRARQSEEATPAAAPRQLDRERCGLHTSGRSKSGSLGSTDVGRQRTRRLPAITVEPVATRRSLLTTRRRRSVKTSAGRAGATHP